MARDNYEHFEQCVEKTYTAALKAMAKNENTIAVLCHLCSETSGKHKMRYTPEKAKEIIVKVLKNEYLSHKDIPLGRYFEKVVFVHQQKSNQERSATMSDQIWHRNAYLELKRR